MAVDEAFVTEEEVFATCMLRLGLQGAVAELEEMPPAWTLREALVVLRKKLKHVETEFERMIGDSIE